MLFVLVFLSLWLGYEAIERLRVSRSDAVESWMIWTSVAALAGERRNHAGLVRGRSDLNLRSILVHNFGDALSNIAIIVGAVIMGYVHAPWIDPILGLAIGLLVLYSSIGILRESTHILLEGRPAKCTCRRSGSRHSSLSSPSRKSTTFTSGHSAAATTLSAVMRAFPICTWINAKKFIQAIQQKVAKEFSIEHTTVQLERAGLPATSGYVMPEPARKP